MKTQWLIRRLIYALTRFPKRILRLFTYPFSAFYHHKNGGSLYRSFPLLLADCLFIIDIYEISTNLFKKSTRLLTAREIGRGAEIFGKSIDFQLVMIDERAQLLTKSMCVIYVSGNTINSWGAIPDDYLIHELVHIWQYQHFGAGYIACALKAQKSEAGYNYTHVSAQPTEAGIQVDAWHFKPSFLNFNAEQQGDLVQDYFKLKNNNRTEWVNSKTKDLQKYEPYIEEIKNI